MSATKNHGLEIIRLLSSEGGFVSGQTISSCLGISRTAVWKHISALKKLGFSIQAGPSKGYSLRMPRNTGLFNEITVLNGLDTEFAGRGLYFYEAVPSTNAKAIELGRNMAPEGSAVIADSQTMGRGRLGRAWVSPARVNLYTSIILRPNVPPQSAHNLTFLSAVSVAETISAFCRKRPVVKWPNDVLIGGKKVAGILLELYSEADRINFIVAGIGVNLNMRGRQFPAAIRKTASSVLEECGSPVDRSIFTRMLYSSIEKWYKIYLRHGFSPVLHAWKGFFDAEGKSITVNVQDRVVSGLCLGVDDGGVLILKTSGGAIERIVSGDVAFAPRI